MKVIRFNQKQFEDFLEIHFNEILKKDDKCLIVGIEEGGMPLAEIALNNLKRNNVNVELIGVKCQRPSTKTKKKNKITKAIIKSVFKLTPEFILDALRNAEHRSLMKSETHTKREVVIPNELDFNQFNKILIIDDAVDSGHSLKNVIEKIKEKTQTDVYSFCVVVTNVNACILPDFYLHSDLLIRFPWSLDG